MSAGLIIISALWFNRPVLIFYSMLMFSAHLVQCVVGDSLNATEALYNAPARNRSGIVLGYVHHGFCEYYRSLAQLGMPEQIAALVTKYPKYKVVLTGHSLGGAAATIAAADLALRFALPRSKLLLYTYGAPRPGDAGFAELVANNIGAAYR
jgi:predicted lipase